MTNMNRHVDPKSLHPAEWSVAEAKARFSEVIARAKAGEPQHVTRYGKDEVVVVSIEDWRRATFQAVCDHREASVKEPTLYDVFEPLLGSGIVFERMKGDLRPMYGDDD